MKTEYFFCEECSGGCGLVVEFPKNLLEICDGGVRIPETCPYMETQGNKAKWKKVTYYGLYSTSLTSVHKK